MIVERLIIIFLLTGALLSLFPDKLELENRDSYIEHISTVLAVTTGKSSENRVRWFIAISIGFGLVVFAVLFRLISFRLSIISMFVAIIMPYALLRVRLQKIQVESSREGEILITELLNNYKINFFNMREAIDKTALSIENAPNSKRLLFNLSKGLQRAGSRDDIDRLLREFKMSINTSWGNILAGNMDFALNSGIKVNEAIGELANTISRARKLAEYSKRENNESKLMLKYLAPCTYLFTIISGITYFGLSFREFIYYQFETEAGLTWFTIAAITYITGVIANSFISGTRLDF